MISANGINLFGHVYSVVHYVSRSLRALGKGSSTFHFWFFILGDNFQFSLRQLVCYSWLLKMWYELVLLKCILVVTVSVGTLQLLEKKSSSRSSIYHYKFFILRGRGWLKGTAVPFFHIIRNASDVSTIFHCMYYDILPSMSRIGSKTSYRIWFWWQTWFSLQKTIQSWTCSQDNNEIQ